MKLLEEGKKELTELERDILSVISTSEISSPIQIANLLDVPEEDVIAILNNDDFYNLICANSLGNMRLAYHSKAIPKLISNLENDKDFYDSYDRLTKAISAVGSKDHEGMKVSLEVLVKEKNNEEKNITPHEPDKYHNPHKEDILKSVSKVSANVFGIQDNTKQSPPIKKKTIEFEFEEDE